MDKQFFASMNLHLLIRALHDFMILFSANANKKTFKTSVQPGWYYSGRKMVRFCMYKFILDLNKIVNVDWFISVALQDTADVEWMMWFSTFRVHIIFALSGHVIFAKICSLLAPQVALESPDTSVLHVTLLTKLITPYGQPERLILSFFSPSHSTDLWCSWCTVCWQFSAVWAGLTSCSSCLTVCCSIASLWSSSSGSALLLDSLHWLLSKWSPSFPGRHVTDTVKI